MSLVNEMRIEAMLTEDLIRREQVTREAATDAVRSLRRRMMVKGEKDAKILAAWMTGAAT